MSFYPRYHSPLSFVFGPPCSFISPFSGLATLSSTSTSIISMICYQPKLSLASSTMDRASITADFALAIATFFSTMIFLSAAKASAALVSFVAWGMTWCVFLSACRISSVSSPKSTRDGDCNGFGFGVWRRLFEQM